MTYELLEAMEVLVKTAKLQKKMIDAAPDEKSYKQALFEFEQLDGISLLGFKPNESKIQGLKKMISQASNYTIQLSDDLITKIIIYANS